MKKKNQNFFKNFKKNFFFLKMAKNGKITLVIGFFVPDFGHLTIF